MCVMLKVLLQAFEKGFKRAMFDRMDTGELDMGAPLFMRSLCPAIKASIVPSRLRPMCMCNANSPPASCNSVLDWNDCSFVRL